MASTSSQALRIAIIGGGPSGLVLLSTLHYRGIRATLYEREQSPSSRSHLGGTLDLGWTSGQRALRENGLEEAFKKHSRPEGDEYKICDGASNVLFHYKDDSKDPVDVRPEIDRSTLRKILLDSVPANSIQWGHALSSVKSLGDGKHEVVFANGVTTVSDVLVGADGAWSRVRPLLSPAVPLYHGITGAEISLAPSVATTPDVKDVTDLIGAGNMFAAQNNKSILSQRNSDGRIRTYAWFRAPSDWVLPSDPNAARQVLLQLYSEEWSPMFLKLIERCDDAAIYVRPLYYLPVGHRWEHVPGVTLIGDAAHLMSPFAGAGANLAMLDGLELGLLLAEAISGGKSAGEREAATAAWEETMFTSAGKMATISKANIEAFINENAPESALEMARAYIGNPTARRDA